MFCLFMVNFLSLLMLTLLILIYLDKISLFSDFLNMIDTWYTMKNVHCWDWLIVCVGRVEMLLLMIVYQIAMNMLWIIQCLSWYTFELNLAKIWKKRKIEISLHLSPHHETAFHVHLELNLSNVVDDQNHVVQLLITLLKLHLVEKLDLTVLTASRSQQLCLKFCVKTLIHSNLVSIKALIHPILLLAFNWYPLLVVVYLLYSCWHCIDALLAYVECYLGGELFLF